MQAKRLGYNCEKHKGQLKILLLQPFFCYLQIFREQFCKRASDNKDAINNNLAE